MGSRVISLDGAIVEVPSLLSFLAQTAELREAIRRCQSDNEGITAADIP